MDVIEMARELGHAIQSDDRYIAYSLATAANDQDTELQQMIDRFNDLRTQINIEVSKKDKDQEKLTQMDHDFKELYATIMARPGMIAYNTTKSELDELLQFVNQIVIASANGANPDEVEMSSGGCSGDCGSCGSCH